MPITINPSGQIITQFDVLVGGASNRIVSIGPGISGQVLQSGGNASNAAYSTSTYPAITTANQLLYSSSSNTVVGLSTANNGILITDGGGVPSIALTLPSAVQGNITSIGTITNLKTSPPSSSTATASFGSTLTVGAPLQNTLGYDILLNIYATVTAATGASFVLGIGPTSAPSTNPVTSTFTSAVALPSINFAAIVPNNYFVLVNTSGTLTLASLKCQVCPL